MRVNVSSPVEITIENMPEFKRAYARAWWTYLTNGHFDDVITSDYNISDDCACDIRTELSMYDTKTGELI